MSIIILRECRIGILAGDKDLWLDTVNDLTISNTTERTLVPRKNLYNRNNTNAVIHRNNDSTSGTFTCYLTSAYAEALLFTLLGCEVYENGFVVPNMLPELNHVTPAKFVIASDINAYEVLDVLITSVTFPLGKGFSGEIQVSFEGGELQQVPRSSIQVFNTKQGAHLPVEPLEFTFNEVAYAPVSANINIAQSVTWLNNRSIYDSYNTRRPVVTGHSVNITTSQYHKQEAILPSFENITIKQGSVQLMLEQASITRRIAIEDEMVTLSCDIQPSSAMPIIQII